MFTMGLVFRVDPARLEFTVLPINNNGLVWAWANETADVDKLAVTVVLLQTVMSIN